ncbi:Gfo/Idh/MocA family oxidoreductase [Candidatus Poribacteria bacterium]|nr:Gfo/Idh/MocA family oxidoreductase [Candidatus Poribacteria bacterium]MYB64584.1 Gfo/Idh/MocA family oxidoreductase [Candidatus Poribacteria bacterium]MYF55724.1 Gfo/Idh/MocA family oxidoreductase [Candidatus Poribacteria bacterium]MYI93058.1 Gfo/Idh/MocA family oxidoreductase [Candidatus Poribacteria bacterium]
MTNQFISLGVIGCGWAGCRAIESANATSRLNVIAIAERDPNRLAQAGDDNAVPHRYTDYQELLENPDVEAVYLATSPDGRLQQVLDTLNSGKHVLVQKPHAIRAHEILEMAAAAQEAEKTLQFCYFMRHFPHNRQIRSAVQNGAIGDLYHARIFGKFNSIPELNANSRWLHVYGQKGGSLGQHYSHELNLTWWWMGSPKPIWAFAAKHVLYPQYDGPEGAAEDYFTGILGCEGGKTIQIDCSRMSHSDSGSVVELYGTTGAITNGGISRFKDGGFIREPIDEPIEIDHGELPEEVPVFYYELNHFAMAIAGEVAPDVDASDAYTFMQILDALYDSAKSGEKVCV